MELQLFAALWCRQSYISGIQYRESEEYQRQLCTGSRAVLPEVDDIKSTLSRRNAHRQRTPVARRVRCPSKNPAVSVLSRQEEYAVREKSCRQRTPVTRTQKVELRRLFLRNLIILSIHCLRHFPTASRLLSGIERLSRGHHIMFLQKNIIFFKFSVTKRRFRVFTYMRGHSYCWKDVIFPENTSTLPFLPIRYRSWNYMNRVQQYTEMEKTMNFKERTLKRLLSLITALTFAVSSLTIPVFATDKAPS